MSTAQTTASLYTAKHRHARISARKARLIANVIRGRSANDALEYLMFAPQRAAAMYLKVLKSAIANADQDEGVNVNRLFLADVRADEGPIQGGRKRYRPGPQGRAMPYTKKTCHLTVRVAEVPEASTGAAGSEGQEG